MLKFNYYLNNIYTFPPLYLNTYHVKVQLPTNPVKEVLNIYLNTYHVKVQYLFSKSFPPSPLNLNTYHVKVQLHYVNKIQEKFSFKYIPC